MELSTTQEKFDCFKASHELRGTKTFVSEDISKATLELRKNELEFLAEKRQQGYMAYFLGADVIVKQRQGQLGNSAPDNTQHLENRVKHYHLKTQQIEH